MFIHQAPLFALATMLIAFKYTCKVPYDMNIIPLLEGVILSFVGSFVLTTGKIIRYCLIFRTYCKRKGKKDEDKEMLLSWYGLFLTLRAVFLFCYIVGIISYATAIVREKASNVNDQLDIYRSEFRLVNISGNIYPPNGSFVNLEHQELNSTEDVFCLSEFEYRSEDYQIYYNFVQLLVVAEDGRFCTTVGGLHNPSNVCSEFYNQSVLYYGSLGFKG
jgi:hypothetical protein